MPVWGPIFKGLDNRDEVNAARIENLVKYLESIQARAKADRREGVERPTVRRPYPGTDDGLWSLRARPARSSRSETVTMPTRRSPLITGSPVWR